MFFCKGKGIFALLFLFASILITTSFTYFILQVENDFSRSKWFLFATFNLAGFFCWTIGKIINSKSPRIFIDPKTNQAVQLVDSKRNTFFFIPVRYWGIIYSVIGIYALIKGDL